jgi:PST family polysaccharide transporter
MTVNRRSAAKSTFWSVVENGGLAAISLGSLVIYTRILSASDFGLFAIALAVVELLGLLVTMLFHDALIQREKVTNLHFDSAFTFTLGLSLILAFVCYAGSPLFAAILKKPEAAPVLSWLTLCLPASALGATIVARQRRELSFRALAVRSLSGRVVGAGVGIVLVLLGAGIWGLVAQQVLIPLVGSLVLWVTCRDRPKIRFRRQEINELARFGMYAVAGLFVAYATNRLFVLLVGIFLGVEATGYLNLGLRLVDVFLSIAGTAVAQVALPMLSRLQSDMVAFRNAFQQASSFVCFTLYAYFLALGSLAPEAVVILFGVRWLPSVPYVTALAFLVVIHAPRMLVGTALVALGRPQDSLASQSIDLIVVVAAILVSRVPTPAWAVGIWVLRAVTRLPMTTWQVQRATGLRPTEQFRVAAVPFVAGLAMILTVVGMRCLVPVKTAPLLRLFLLLPGACFAFGGIVYLLHPRLLRDLSNFMHSALDRRTSRISCEAPEAPKAEL